MKKLSFYLILAVAEVFLLIFVFDVFGQAPAADFITGPDYLMADGKPIPGGPYTITAEQAIELFGNNWMVLYDDDVNIYTIISMDNHVDFWNKYTKQRVVSDDAVAFMVLWLQHPETHSDVYFWHCFLNNNWLLFEVYPESTNEPVNDILISKL